MSNILVLAAHADDETLGCYYAIQKHLDVGDNVTVMLMTYDDLRRQEFVKASLPGVAHVFAEGLTDDYLRHQVPEMTEQIYSELINTRPDIVYCHSRNEPSFVSDHRAVYDAFVIAAAYYGKPLTLAEFPVWQYCSYPWVKPPRRGKKSLSVYVWQTLKYLWRTLTNPVCFGRGGGYEVIMYGDMTAKKQALSHYSSQLPGLSHVACGGFLRQFIKREVFRKTRLN